MENLDYLGVKEITELEKQKIDGGSDPDGCAGCAAGAAVRKFFSSIWESMSKHNSGGYAGMGYY